MLTARDAVGDEPFVVILPDDIVDHTRGLLPRGRGIRRTQSGVVAVEPMPWETVHNYGGVDAIAAGDRLHQVKGLVEKPPREEAPSNLSIVGRSYCQPEIFDCLERTPPGAEGEIQLTDGMLLLLGECGSLRLRIRGDPIRRGPAVGPATGFAGIRSATGCTDRRSLKFFEASIQRNRVRKTALSTIQSQRENLESLAVPSWAAGRNGLLPGLEA